MPEKITFDYFIRKAGIVTLVVLAILIVKYLGEVLLPFVVAWLFAYLLYPIVRFVQDKLRVKIRALAIVITFIFRYRNNRRNPMVHHTAYDRAV